MAPTPSEADLRRRLAQLSLEEKTALLTGANGWSTASAPAAALPSLTLSDGPAGVRGGGFGEDVQSCLFPNPTALAATWDESLAYGAGRLMGVQARALGVHWLLAPVLNLHRSPYGGRHFECFSEDPLLTARTAAAYVRGVQSAGVVATAKHFVGNESETGRLSYDARIDEKTLREVYLAPFHAVVRAGVGAVRAAYNSVNGTLATENHRLLTEVLKGEWGFDGVVVSDWGAARSTEATALAGLDLVMPGPAGPWGDALVAAVEDGRIPQEAIDDKVLRLLRLAGRIGAAPAITPPDAADTRQTVRALASRAMVLLRNDSGLLPLDPAAKGRTALIGPNAVRLTVQGGGSAQVYPERVVQPLDGLRRVLGGDAAIDVQQGVLTHTNLPHLSHELVPDGVRLDFLDHDGHVLQSQHRDDAHIVLEEIPAGARAVTLRTRVQLDSQGRHMLSVYGGGTFTWHLGDGEPLAFDLPVPDRDPLSLLVEPAEFRSAAEAGGTDIQVRLALDPQAEWHVFGLGHLPPHPPQEEMLACAVAAARDADRVILVVGTTEEYESEGFDRTGLALPGHQDELVRRVCRANPRTVVVVNAGAPVLMPWAKLPAALLWAWLPGQEGGNALADVLYGLAEPGGRLPTTFPDTEEDLPSVQPEDGTVAYRERHLLGYRTQRQVLHPFGHGLGYTTWDYTEADVRVAQDGTLAAAVTLRNSGTRAGREIVQIYLAEVTPPRSPHSAPMPGTLRLIGFAAVEAAPGEATTAHLSASPTELRRWTEQGWTPLTDRHRVLVGRSSTDIRLTVDADFTAPQSR
ncbi:glycoside hydrolase family 3 protein [Streptomyces sp. ISL-44]|uniref:beta-glucosidase n=1 Tax=Streptomyces sp. ISL-44 TaxID=2819184 RepID=UPI001BEA51A1|nr:glycoside hydrolase family 3 protein [Streptomyces sp. ISL-44]MBT2542682.1 glycoside hydrolase family 3 protein [Streptomyces sp. ISL-44]